MDEYDNNLAWIAGKLMSIDQRIDKLENTQQHLLKTEAFSRMPWKYIRVYREALWMQALDLASFVLESALFVMIFILLFVLIFRGIQHKVYS